ncbi:MAG: glycosyltransferase [Candidatus Cryptobacteroides sp.]
MPRVSIITPVHNSSGEIRRYLDCVIGQTFQNLEVIIVDDHGTDDAIGIARKVIGGYSGPIQFRIIQTPGNSGPGIARNLGIDSATGDYLAFVDSDDEIDPRFCELLVESAEKNRSDLCCCNLDVIDSTGRLSGTRRNPQIPDGEFSGEKRRFFLHNYISYFTTFIYRRELFEVNRIHFPDGRSSEDTAMLCCALICCRRISTVDLSLYKYIRKPESLSGSSDGKRYLYKLSALGETMRVLRDQGWYEADKEEIDFIYFKKGYLMAVFDYISTNRTAKTSVLEDIRAELLETVPDYRKNRYLRRSAIFRILDFALTSVPHLAIPFIRLYMKRLNRSVI